MSDQPRIVVFGGSEYSDKLAIQAALNRVFGKRGVFVVVHRGLHKVDAVADAWARRRNLPVVEHSAWWQCHGDEAVKVMNVEVVESGLDGAVAFPGGLEEAHLASELTKQGVAIWRPVEAA